MAQIDQADAWAWAALEPEPTEQEQALYETFCREYLVDRSYARAASRCGFQAQFALDYGKMLFSKSYVQRRLAELERIKADPVKEREFDAVNIRARLRSIVNDETQKGSARVAAARELNAMHGLHAPTKVAHTVQSGGAVLVPVMSLDDWEKAAAASQSKLMEESKVD